MYFDFNNHASKFHALSLKIKFQKCIRKFCFISEHLRTALKRENCTESEKKTISRFLNAVHNNQRLIRLSFSYFIYWSTLSSCINTYKHYTIEHTMHTYLQTKYLSSFWLLNWIKKKYVIVNRSLTGIKKQGRHSIT